MRPLMLISRGLGLANPAASIFRPQNRLLSSLSRPSFALRTFPRSTPRHLLPSRRYETSLTYQNDKPETPKGRDQPAYDLTFTCKPCLYRSTHRITKQGYHHGTVLITCPSCKNRHVISDHLHIFMDAKSTLEDMLRRKLAEGEDLTKYLKKGKLGIRQDAVIGNEGEEDLEFWEDGTETVHRPAQQSADATEQK